MSDAILAKLVVSGLCLVSIIGLVLVNPKADNRRLIWMYRGVTYRMIFNSDGSLRRYTKPLLMVWVLLCLLAFWIFW